MTSLWRGLHHGVGPVRCAPPHTHTFCPVPTPFYRAYYYGYYCYTALSRHNVDSRLLYPPDGCWRGWGPREPHTETRPAESLHPDGRNQTYHGCDSSELRARDSSAVVNSRLIHWSPQGNDKSGIYGCVKRTFCLFSNMALLI